MLRGFVLVGVLEVLCLSMIAPAQAADLIRVEGGFVRWPRPSVGTTTVVTYAVLEEPYVIARNTRTLSSKNCGVMQAFPRIMDASAHVTVASARQELRAAFAAWASAADIEFVEASAPSLAHIVVGASETQSGRAFANLTLRGEKGMQRSADKALGRADGGTEPGQALPSHEKDFTLIEQAFVCLNPKARWKIGFDGDLTVYDLRHAFMHEIGHAIGLDHPGRSGSVMGFRYDERVIGIQPSDVAAIRLLYGAPLGSGWTAP